MMRVNLLEGRPSYSHKECQGCATLAFFDDIVWHLCIVARYCEHKKCPCANCLVKSMCNESCQPMYELWHKIRVSNAVMYCSKIIRGGN